MVWNSHVFQNFQPFIVKGSGIINKEEIDVFLELSCSFNDPADVGAVQGVVAVRAQEGLEELLHVQGQEGWR